MRRPRLLLLAFIPWSALYGGCGTSEGPGPLDAGADVVDGGTGDAPSVPDGPSPREIIPACTTAGRVDPSSVKGAVPACPSGYAHPNVCCWSAPAEATVCVECTAGSPFDACGAGSLSFPDPVKCCSLDDPAQCVQPEGLDASPVANARCSLPCGPGGFLPSAVPNWPGPICPPTPTNGCAWCCDDGTPVPGFTSSPGCYVWPCSCPVALPDADASCECGPSCAPCPSGWQVPTGGQVDLCCRAGDGGAAECFSQAVGVTPHP